MSAINENMNKVIAVTASQQASNATPAHYDYVNTAVFEIGQVIPLTGYFLLEYTPDDGRGRIADVDKTPLIGFATALVNNKFGIFPMTLRGLHLHAPEKRPTILCPCGGIQGNDVFFDSMSDYMQAMEYLHTWKYQS